MKYNRIKKRWGFMSMLFVVFCGRALYGMDEIHAPAIASDAVDQHTLNTDASMESLYQRFRQVEEALLLAQKGLDLIVTDPATDPELKEEITTVREKFMSALEWPTGQAQPETMMFSFPLLEFLEQLMRNIDKVLLSATERLNFILTLAIGDTRKGQLIALQKEIGTLRLSRHLIEALGKVQQGFNWIMTTLIYDPKLEIAIDADSEAQSEILTSITPLVVCLRNHGRKTDYALYLAQQAFDFIIPHVAPGSELQKQLIAIKKHIVFILPRN